MAVAYDMKVFSVSHFFPSRQRYRRRADERARGEGWKGGGGRINWGQSLLSKLAQVPIGHWATCRNVFTYIDTHSPYTPPELASKRT